MARESRASPLPRLRRQDRRNRREQSCTTCRPGSGARPLVVAGVFLRARAEQPTQGLVGRQWTTGGENVLISALHAPHVAVRIPTLTWTRSRKATAPPKRQIGSDRHEAD